jgi:poly(3-hydroxybutyrate) depolymerase
MLVLWQFEECEHSQPVRAKLTELGIDFIAINAPEGLPEKDAVMVALFGSAETPAMWDTQTGALVQGEGNCLEYLERKCQNG